MSTAGSLGLDEMPGRDNGAVSVFSASNRQARSGRLRGGCCYCSLPAGGVVGVKGEEIVGDALRLGGGAEDFFSVGMQHLQPGLDMGGTVSKSAVGNPKFRAYHELRDLGPKFFPRIVW
jgi:hypothetical protein